MVNLSKIFIYYTITKFYNILEGRLSEDRENGEYHVPGGAAPAGEPCKMLIRYTNEFSEGNRR